MQNDIKTKSSDFLPGKPSIDSVAKSSAPPNTDENLQPTAAPASAHVIDLKQASVSPVDSPLLNSQPPKEPTNIAPAPTAAEASKTDKSNIEVKPIFNEPATAEQASTPPNPPPPAKTNIDNLNLTDASNHQEAAKPDKSKKPSKLKWILFAFLSIIVAAAIIVGVIYLLNTVAQ